MAITAHTQYHNKNIATSIKISIKQSHDYNKKQNDNNFCTWYKTIKKSESDTVYKFLSSICFWDDKNKLRKSLDQTPSKLLWLLQEWVNTEFVYEFKQYIVKPVVSRAIHLLECLFTLVTRRPYWI